MIKAKKISYSAGKTKILQDVDFEVKKSEIVGLLGPSGAGKTTLINNLAGQLSPNSGEVCEEDRVIPYKGYYHKIGYMMQDSTLYSKLSVMENLKFFGDLFDVKNFDERAKEKLEFAKLTDHVNKKVCNLSGGMKRRLSLAITLLHDPDIIFLDEPTVGIDPVLREVFWEEFVRLKEAGKSIVITTHLLSDANRCDRIVVIKDGKNVASGTISELQDKFSVSSLEDIYYCASK